MDIEKLLAGVQKAAGKLALIALSLIGAVVALTTLKETPAAVVASTLGVVAVLLLFFLPTQETVTAELENKEWLNVLQRHVRDATEVKAYLRSFKHPDHMKKEYREEVLELMRVFVSQLAEHPDRFRLMAYHSHQNETDPQEWLKSELQRKLGGHNAVESVAATLSKCVLILPAQPYPNSSTIYVIDNRIIMFSYSADGIEAKHYKMTLNGSIVPIFITESISRYFSKAS